MYLILVTDWGFAFTAPSQISRERDDKVRINTIFWSVLFAKMALGCVTLALFYGAVALVPPLRAMSLLLVCASGLVVANVLTVNWCLQGMERMGAFAVASVIGRGCTVPATFLLVQGQDDAWLAALIQAGGSAVGGGISIFLLARLRTIGAPVFSPADIVAQIREAMPLFLSSIAVNIYTSTNMIVLGMLHGPAAVGLYAPADRLRMTAQAVIPPISQAVYPRVSRMFSESRAHGIEFSQHLLVVLGMATFLGSLLLFAAAGPLLVLIAGPMFAEAVPVLRWLALVPLMVAINTVLGMQMMLPLGMNKPFSRVLIRAAVLDLVLIVPLSWYFGAQGTAIAVLLAELWVVGDMAFQLRHAGVPILPEGGITRDLLRTIAHRIRR
jgi:O-antigen/teichoic acid export membrane protein